MTPPDIILIRPQHAGNVGSICRLIKNFGAGRLILVNPACEINEDARRLAMHGKDILADAKIVPALPTTYDLLIATTSQTGGAYNLPRTPLLPRQAAERLAQARGKVAIVFGPEDAGLTNEEILSCHLTLTIPASAAYPTLNLSHSAAVILYELFHEEHGARVRANFPLATENQKKTLDRLLKEIIGTHAWGTPQRAQTQERLWHNIIGRSMLTSREAQSLLGFLKKSSGNAKHAEHEEHDQHLQRQQDKKLQTKPKHINHQKRLPPGNAVHNRDAQHAHIQLIDCAAKRETTKHDHTRKRPPRLTCKRKHRKRQDKRRNTDKRGCSGKRERTIRGLKTLAFHEDTDAQVREGIPEYGCREEQDQKDNEHRGIRPEPLLEQGQRKISHLAHGARRSINLIYR
ncbi:MAG: RNA methyltransferase [Nitrosarchaeum sp.]|nr:RNA methyltransferase [Nitrosarchaeum sp.]